MITKQQNERELMKRSRFSLFFQDTKNYFKAQLAVRLKFLYCPSLFGHLGVNSVCNLRCSYCYVHEPETFFHGFTEAGLPLESAKKVLDHLREECLSIRFQGGEPFLYKQIVELTRYAKESLRFRNVSIITNGLPISKDPKKYRELLKYVDVITLSIDETRFKEYPDEMAKLMAFLPELKKMCEEHKVGLTSNYTATWEELAHPERIEKAITAYQKFIPYYYVMPVRKIGKVPLDLLKNSQTLNRKYSLGYYRGHEYPKKENVPWYQRHCNPKLKIKVNAQGELIYPCENYSSTIGSLVDHPIRTLWSKKLTKFPNIDCLGCGKQRFRLKAFKRIDQQILFALKKRWKKLYWERTKLPIYPHR